MNTCKEQSVVLYSQGAFGNRLRQWDTLSDLDRDGFQYPIVIRYRHPLGGGGPCYYHIQRDQVPSILEEIQSNGWNLDYVYFNEGAPDHKAILQGELRQYDDGSFVLFYNTLPTHMRDALAHPSAREVEGRLGILDRLRRAMSPSSYSDMECLLEMYPGHVIEFTTYSCFIGNLKGRNTIFWDCRYH